MGWAKELREASASINALRDERRREQAATCVTIDALRTQLAARAADAAGSGSDAEANADAEEVADARITIAALQAEIDVLEAEANENEGEIDASRCVVCISLFDLPLSLPMALSF